MEMRVLNWVWCFENAGERIEWNWVCVTYGNEWNSLHLECWDGAQGWDFCFFEFTGSGYFLETSACGGLGTGFCIPEPIWLGFGLVVEL